MYWQQITAKLQGIGTGMKVLLGHDFFDNLPLHRGQFLVINFGETLKDTLPDSNFG